MRPRLGLSFVLLGLFACGNVESGPAHRRRKPAQTDIHKSSPSAKKQKAAKNKAAKNKAAKNKGNTRIKKIRKKGKVVARSSARCGECHEAYNRTWKASAHATATSSAYFRVSAAGDERCAPCHTPLVGQVADDDPIHEEGITCDACHSITEVDVDAPSPGLTFDLSSSVKYGPLCDSKTSYFHRAGCSPLHSQSRFCAGCHSLEWPAGDGTMLPVITDFDEWSAKEKPGATCQDCHMSGTEGEVSRGWATRDKISRHDLFGTDDELLRAGVNLEALMRTGENGSQSLEVTLENRGALHSIPAGLAGRRLVLSVRFDDREGRSVGEFTRIYARMLVDAEGHEVLFTEARALGEDSRLHSGERRIERFKAPPSATIAELRLERFAQSPEVAAHLEIAAPEGTLILRTEVTIEQPNR